MLPVKDEDESKQYAKLTPDCTAVQANITKPKYTSEKEPLSLLTRIAT